MHSDMALPTRLPILRPFRLARTDETSSPDAIMSIPITVAFSSSMIPLETIAALSQMPALARKQSTVSQSLTDLAETVRSPPTSSADWESDIRDMMDRSLTEIETSHSLIHCNTQTALSVRNCDRIVSCNLSVQADVFHTPISTSLPSLPMISNTDVEENGELTTRNAAIGAASDFPYCCTKIPKSIESTNPS